MTPLAEIWIERLPMIPKCLEGIALVTVFISEEMLEVCEPIDGGWLVREYMSAAEVVHKDLPEPDTYLNDLPISATRFDNDWPSRWDDIDFDSDEVIVEESANSIEPDAGSDEGEHLRSHKVGGYPTFCQSPEHPGVGFEFAFQIASDDQINLTVVDDGALQFYRNPETREWTLYFDFY